MKSFKRISKLFMLVLVVFCTINVFASESKLKVTDVKIIDKSDTVIYQDAIIDNNVISLDAIFNEENDFITYELTLKNLDTDSWKIDTISDNNITDNLKIDYSFNQDVLNKGDTSKVEIKFTYKNKFVNHDDININDILISLNLISDSGVQKRIVINPSTFDGIMKYILLFLASISGFIILYAFRKHKKLKTGSFIILLLIIILPFVVYAKEEYKLNLSIRAITLKSGIVPVNVEFNTNGGNIIDSISVDYGSAIGELPVPIKDNYEFDGWYSDSDFNNKVLESTIIKNDLIIYAKWNKILFPVVFSQEDACTFNGKNGEITGCSKYSGQKYIDTGISLYTEENFQKDFELYFEIDEFDSNIQDDVRQQTFVSSKYETLNAELVPGFVVRYNNDGATVFSEAFNNKDKTTSFTTSRLKNVKIVRKDGITYYSFNGDSLNELCNLNGFSEYFDVSVTFGAALTRDNEAFRFIKGKLSNMYIKLGKYPSNNHKITFNANEGLTNTLSKIVDNDATIGTIPKATRNGYYLDGWYTSITGGEKLTSLTTFDSDVSYYARWKKSVEIARFSNDPMIIRTGETKKIKIENLDEIEEKLTFTSSNKNVVTVDSEGNITGVREGNATITIKGVNSLKTLKLGVIVCKDKYVVSFNSNGGSTVKAKSIDYNGVLGELDIPIRIGYKFDGWYKDSEYSEQVNKNTIVDSDLDLFAKWNKVEYDLVFSQEGACTFNGKSGVITGEECSNYNGLQYIDTNVSLYNSTNYKKDYEIYFEIDEFDFNGQDSGSNNVFMNSKLENASIKYPGIVFRKDGDNLVITQTINGVKKSQNVLMSPTDLKSVKIVRNSGIIYYSFNNSDYMMLQDMNDTSQYFNITVWFGAAPDKNGKVFRQLKGTLSNMYIKLEK